MSSYIDEFMKMYGSQASKQLAGNLGLSSSTVQKMIPEIAPLILSGLKKQMQEKGGAPRVDHILNKYGDQSVLNNIAQAISQKAQDTRTDSTLGGLLGNPGLQAASQLAKQFNIDANTASKIIPMLAPLLLGFLTQKRDQQGLGSQGIAALIDQDGDGQILDDVLGYLAKGSTRTSSPAKSNVLGSLLGSLLKRR